MEPQHYKVYKSHQLLTQEQMHAHIQTMCTRMAGLGDGGRVRFWEQSPLAFARFCVCTRPRARMLDGCVCVYIASACKRIKRKDERCIYASTSVLRLFTTATLCSVCNNKQSAFFEHNCVSKRTAATAAQFRQGAGVGSEE